MTSLGKKNNRNRLKKKSGKRKKSKKWKKKNSSLLQKSRVKRNRMTSKRTGTDFQIRKSAITSICSNSRKLAVKTSDSPSQLLSKSPSMATLMKTRMESIQYPKILKDNSPFGSMSMKTTIG